MPLVSSIVKLFSSSRMKQIELFMKRPEETQQKVLQRLLYTSRQTEWGKKYDYSSVISEARFRERVPLQTYDHFVPVVERLRKGEKDVVWPGEVRWFAKSSGTTSTRSKFIPVTGESLENTHFRGAKDCIIIYTNLVPDTRIFPGKGLTLGGSHQINNFSNSSLFGDLSAILIENAPFWAGIIRTPPAHIALIDDFEEKMKRITEVVVGQNITSIAGVPSWNLVLIRNILETTGRDNLHEVWPNLEVFFHGGVAFGPYREIYRQIMPDPRMKFIETYNASEGFFAIQDDLSDISMLLMLDYGVYYEFIPTDQISSDNPKVLSIAEVEKDVNYAIVISTDGGLWRYIVGDTVTFTNLYPHKIRITGRTKHFINAFGEEVIIDNAEKALENACRTTGAHILEYTAGPVYMSGESKGAHEWIIEFDRQPDDLNRFINILDKTLQEVNTDYEAKRYKDLTLSKPIVRSVPAGTFYRWFKERDKLGGQNKIPRLSNDREVLESVRRIAGI